MNQRHKIQTLKIKTCFLFYYYYIITKPLKTFEHGLRFCILGLMLKVSLSLQEITDSCVRASYRVATVAASPSLHPITCVRVRFDSTNSPGKKTQPAATRSTMAPWGHLCLGTRARTCVCADTHSGWAESCRGCFQEQRGGGATCQSANTSDLQPFNPRGRELNVSFKKKSLKLYLLYFFTCCKYLTNILKKKNASRFMKIYQPNFLCLRIPGFVVLINSFIKGRGLCVRFALSWLASMLNSSAAAQNSILD